VVPTTGDHIILFNFKGGLTLFRNNSLPTNPNPYPFTLPGVIQLTTTATPDPLRHYTYLYDLRLSLANCPSTRTPIVATDAVVPVITVNTATFTSSANTGNQWHRDGNPIAGATNPTYTAIQSGTYKTVVTDDFGCSTSSNEISVTVTGIPNIDPAEIGLKVMPNPNDGKFGLQFKVNTRADLVISMYNAVGQEVFRNTYPGFTGSFTKQMELGRLARGVYTLKVQHDKKNYLHKIIVR
jgi:hypothetical protein